MGADANFFYKYGKDYERHNISQSHSQYGSPDSSLDPALVFGWTGGRTYKLLGLEQDDYGSNILQAGMVEAFRGVRNDPNMPPVLTYIFPFIWTVELADYLRVEDGVASGVDAFSGWAAIVDPYDSTRFKVCGASVFGTNGSDEGYGLDWPVDQDDNPLTWDQVIRYHDNRQARVIGMGNGKATMGSSLLSHSLMLRTFAYGGSGAIGASTFRTSMTSSPAPTSGFAPVWTNPASTPSPYSISETLGSNNEETSTTATGIANFRLLWNNQINTARYFTYELGQFDSATGITDITDKFPKLDNNFGYNNTSFGQNTIALKLEFGSHPWNVTGDYLPYKATAHSTPGTDKWTAEIHGRFTIQVIGDSPFRYSSQATTAA